MQQEPGLSIAASDQGQSRDGRNDRSAGQVERVADDPAERQMAPADLRRLIAVTFDFEAGRRELVAESFGDVQLVEVSGGAKGQGSSRWMIPVDLEEPVTGPVLE